MHRTMTAIALLMTLAACNGSEQNKNIENTSNNNDIIASAPAPIQCKANEVAVDFGCLPLSENLAQLADTFEWDADDLAATCLDPELPQINCELRYSEDEIPHDVAVISGELAVDNEHNNGSGSLAFDLRKDDVTGRTTLTLENHTWDMPQTCEAAHMNCESVFTMVKADGDTEELGRIDSNQLLKVEVDDALAAKMSGTVRLEVGHYEAGTLYSTDAFITPRAEFVAAMARMRQNPTLAQVRYEYAD